MSDYQLTFKLKQHTPLIHFQWDQKGATLRASEVKPKLDKFLIEKLALTKTIHINGKDMIVPKQNYESWFNNKEKLSLDYKVRITDLDSEPFIGEVVVMPPTIENWVLSKDISLELTTFHLNLKKEIKSLITLFFCLTNFGKRQNKGFGCFYPDSLTEEVFTKEIIKNGKSLYKSNQNLRDNIQTSTYFYDNIIAKKWGELKSGVNIFLRPTSIYIKSSVFRYLEDKTIRWDKRWIKRNIKSLIHSGQLSEDLAQRKFDPIDLNKRNSWNDTTNEAYRFGRAMLGLAEHYEFLTVNRNVKYKVNVSHNEIERFKSPVLFKIFERSMFAIDEYIPSEMFSTPFSFEVQKKIKTNNEWHDYGHPIAFTSNLETPAASQFNLVQFLTNYLPSIGFKKV